MLVRLASRPVASRNCRTLLSNFASRSRMKPCFGEGFTQLLDYPLRIWMSGHVEVQDLASTMVNNEQAVQKLERDGWDREEIE